MEKSSIFVYHHNNKNYIFINKFNDKFNIDNLTLIIFMNFIIYCVNIIKLIFILIFILHLY